MQLTVTCPECAGFKSLRVENGTTVRVFHNCIGRVIKGNKEPSPIHIWEVRVLARDLPPTIKESHE